HRPAAGQGRETGSKRCAGALRGSATGFPSPWRRSLPSMRNSPSARAVQGYRLRLHGRPLADELHTRTFVAIERIDRDYVKRLCRGRTPHAFMKYDVVAQFLAPQHFSAVLRKLGKHRLEAGPRAFLAFADHGATVTRLAGILGHQRD